MHAHACTYQKCYRKNKQQQLQQRQQTKQCINSVCVCTLEKRGWKNFNKEQFI